MTASTDRVAQLLSDGAAHDFDEVASAAGEPARTESIVGWHDGSNREPWDEGGPVAGTRRIGGPDHRAAYQALTALARQGALITHDARSIQCLGTQARGADGASTGNAALDEFLAVLRRDGHIATTNYSDLGTGVSQEAWTAVKALAAPDAGETVGDNLVRVLAAHHHSVSIVSHPPSSLDVIQLIEGPGAPRNTAIPETSA